MAVKEGLTMTAKVENHCAQHRTARTISVDRSARACVNCIWYEQYYYKSFGDWRAWTPTNKGYCLFHEQQRGPLALPCESFEQQES